MIIIPNMNCRLFIKLWWLWSRQTLTSIIFCTFLVHHWLYNRNIGSDWLLISFFELWSQSLLLDFECIQRSCQTSSLYVVEDGSLIVFFLWWLFSGTAGDILNPVTSINKTIVTHLKAPYKWYDSKLIIKGVILKCLVSILLQTIFP